MTIDRIDVSYKIVTPLFCGGARPTTAELRVPSFKGVLRWWWRSLAWSKYDGELAKVAAVEDELFGSAHGGQSKVIMRLVPATLPAMLKKDDVLKLEGRIVGEGARYLGYGVMGAFGRTAGQLTRGCLQGPFQFKLSMHARDLDALMRESLLEALQLVGTLGGLGAKNRKGYGSLVLQSLSLNGTSCWSPPASPGELHGVIEGLLASAMSQQESLPPYTALSARTRVVLVAADGQSHPLALLDRVGRELMRFRSWGHNGRVLGTESERNFKEDHDLMKKAPAQRTGHPQRIIFGLPHNYGKYQEQQVGPAAEGLDRRGSPLLIHIHECGTTHVAVLSLLPAQFLPDGDRALVNVGGKKLPLAAEQQLWKPAGDLLDRFLDPGERKEPFGKALEVLA